MRFIAKKLLSKLYKKKIISTASEYIADLIDISDGITSCKDYQIINEYPHDLNAFTQGIVFDQGILYESTGLKHKSSLRKVDLESGKIIKIVKLPPEYFGEGITFLGEKIYQLTWKDRIGFVYDKRSFRLLSKFSYPTEGWGLTNDGTYLIMSDGTATLRFYNPDNLLLVKQIDTHYNSTPVGFLNDLEYIKGQIFANIWQSEYIAIVSPVTGQINGWLNLTGLLDTLDSIKSVDVLNGIAYNEIKDTVYVTGKFWPKLFEINL